MYNVHDTLNNIHTVYVDNTNVYWGVYYIHSNYLVQYTMYVYWGAFSISLCIELHTFSEFAEAYAVTMQIYDDINVQFRDMIAVAPVPSLLNVFHSIIY